LANVLITGVSGYIGSKLAHALRRCPWAETLAGLDIQDPRDPPPDLQFHRQDIRAPLQPLIEQHEIDTVVHTAYVLTPIHDKALMEDINISGTRNVLEACAASGVSHLLYTSSTTAYGFHPDNDDPLTENSPLRGNDDFTYSKNKREIEAIFASFTSDHPAVTVTILRPCFVVGPGFDNPLARHLKKRFVLLPRFCAPFQFVHEDDLIRLMTQCLEKKIGGVYNVAGEGLITFPEMVTMLGNTVVPLPAGVMAAANHLAWHLRLKFISEFPSPALNLMKYKWIATSEKLIRETGFEFEYDSKGAFEAFAKHVLRQKME
jgi:UDP-glucose 4-epimerase